METMRRRPSEPRLRKPCAKYTVKTHASSGSPHAARSCRSEPPGVPRGVAAGAGPTLLAWLAALFFSAACSSPRFE